MSYIIGACVVSRWNEESIEDMYGDFLHECTVKGVDYRVVEQVKRSTELV